MEEKQRIIDKIIVLDMDVPEGEEHVLDERPCEVIADRFKVFTLTDHDDSTICICPREVEKVLFGGYYGSIEECIPDASVSNDVRLLIENINEILGFQYKNIRSIVVL